MVDFHNVTRDHVLAAMAEYDRMGADDFLERHGFGRAREYVLWSDGRSYDSKAILGVAYQRATGLPLSADGFSGGKCGAARVLRDLGFDVTSPEVTAELDDLPETGRWRSVADVGNESARASWADAARSLLLDTARHYHSVITYKLGLLCICHFWFSS
ncbi:hypothetical protein [Georgenia sp. SUBG003]|uniref:hypothetical protein n=1 Tax=Georgenia sp. SUBG003 TaxID=1497974 RepID=UPI003AB32D34